jgi:hypothetical protein
LRGDARSISNWVVRHRNVTKLRELIVDFTEYRPILSGLVGGLVATIVCAAWSKWLPRGMNGKTADILLRQHRTPVRFANVAFLAGICIALYMYGWGGYMSSDWRPIALGAGISLTAPLVILPLVAWSRRSSAGEAYIAFALSQRMPTFVLYPLLVVGVALLAVAIAKLWR